MKEKINRRKLLKSVGIASVMSFGVRPVTAQSVQPNELHSIPYDIAVKNNSGIELPLIITATKESNAVETFVISQNIPGLNSSNQEKDLPNLKRWEVTEHEQGVHTVEARIPGVTVESEQIYFNRNGIADSMALVVDISHDKEIDMYTFVE